MKPQSTIKFYFLGMLLFFASISKATNFYVDPSSTASTQTGTISAPWKTLSQVQSNMNSFNAGDFIYFKRGETFTGSLNISRSGTASAPITFATYGTASAAPIFTNTSGDLFKIFNRQYLVFDGFKVTDFTLDPNDRNQEAIIDIAFYIDGSNNITIKNCDISLVGVGINMVGDYNTMDRCTIGNLRMIRNTVGGDDDYGANPVVISGSNNNITSNYFQDCWAYSYDYTYDGGAIEIYGSSNNNNKIMYNTATNCDGFMEIGYAGGGTTNDNIVAYNKIVNCGELVYISNSGTYSTAVNNLQFYNNVIVHTVNQLTMPTSMIGMSASSSTPNIVNMKNNIFWLTTGIDVARSGKFTGGQLTHEDNIYHLGTGSILNFTIGTTELSTMATIFTSTAGTNPLVWNYVPIAGSPAIDFGQNLGISRDFAGNIVPSVPNSGILESAAPTTLTASSTGGTISCNGGTTTVTVTATGGTAPYTGTGTFTVSAGTYNYTVTDAASATSNTSITITQPTLLNAAVSSGTITTYGGTTSITVNATGGTGAYTYKLNSGSYQSSNTFTGVSAGSHTVTVKDANGCTKAQTITITQPAPAQLVAASTSGNIGCNGGSTNITVTATGGVAPYTGTGTFAVNAGTYTYTVTDALGTTANTSITVAQPSAIIVTLSSGTIAIYGGTTTLTANATGGTGSYTYKLNSGSYQASNIFSNVAAGTHNVTVKDANGCTAVKSITITQPPVPTQLVAGSTAGTIDCNGGTTIVTVTATGGVSPYTGTGTFTVSAGTYTYTVTDASGTTSTTNITITQPTVISASIAAGTIAVYGGTTTVVVTAGGGTGTYTYKLNSGSYQTSNTFSGVAAGNHSVTVKDNNGCTSVKNFILTQPPAPAQLVATSTAGVISCNGGTTTVTVNATGGVIPYTGTGNFNVVAGTYTYTVTDASGTTASTTVSISQPAVIDLTLSSGTITVNGGTTNITATSTGGTGTFTYKLNGGSFQASNVFNAVSAGTHSVTAKDANGCTSVKNITITQPVAGALNVTATATNINCNAQISTITVSATGGTAPYTGTGLFTGYAGTYTYTVTDANGASASTILTITQPLAIVVTISAAAIPRIGGTTTVVANTTGGTAPYSFKLNTGSFQASNTFTNVTAGSYSITVKDANGCSVVNNFSLSDPGSSNFRISVIRKSNVICRGSATGSLEVLAMNGRAPYTYKINNGRYSTSPLFKNLVSGVYRVYAKDANGNEVSLVSYIFDGRTLCNADIQGSKLNITAYPNPTSDRFSLAIQSESDENVVVEVMNMNGTKVYVGRGNASRNYVFGNDFLAGTYFVRVTQGKDVKTTTIIKGK